VLRVLVVVLEQDHLPQDLTVQQELRELRVAALVVLVDQEVLEVLVKDQADQEATVAQEAHKELEAML
jgi:hypothetical protein